ncbi:uncharacterized protein LOC121367125 isoform X1 [Gigantopelta aegis]|uniref:uncharacterized protein LOC121367125 isoform X1 n=2 Tax=Gigantopelta aegis TaxID=1735272 RepID=UPI001B88916A|nr:uncharacterized protein LOC121367125 isoform X1 [Gigantopelta aegis]
MYLFNQQKHFFDEESGLWQFESLSNHQPLEEGDPVLQAAMRHRLSLLDGLNGAQRDFEGNLWRDRSGPFSLYPPAIYGPCLCGAGYYNAYTMPVGILSDVKYQTIVYTTNGPCRFEVKFRECLQRNHDCLIPYDGSSHCLHFLSRNTAAGDEIGWDFVDRVLNTNITFSAYCTLMTNQYQRLYSLSAKFMSPQTFIAWWLSWASNFKVDFRVVCDICKYEPKYLACDGTKIGINFRHASVTPIEIPSTDVKVDPCHRRNERAFIHYKQGDLDIAANIKCREHLLYLSKYHRGLLKDDQKLPWNDQTDRTNLLVETVDRDCREIVKRFSLGEYSNLLQFKLAIVFAVLSSNSSLTSLIPYRYLTLTAFIITSLRNAVDSDCDFVNDLRQFSPELRDIVHFALDNRESLLEVLDFIEYLVLRVKDIHGKNKAPDFAVPQPGTYNPEKYGRAYYFNPTGEQLRHLPKYSMNEHATSKNYDDQPAREEEKCNKIFPQVSRKGTTYLFLWFDPKHYGHCYGYHMIPGSEGRKDPFTSAYLYLEKAPEELFYDFSCQLEEYCLNREPGYWQNTRFWHDVFHGFSHKCPVTYKSRRILSLRKMSTEICEQFNSFIQRIKYSARAMSTGKFNHYLQFMIHHWCIKKKASFQKRCNVAATYLL